MSYVLRRIGQAILVLVLAYTAAYLLLAALPGDAVIARYAAPELGLTPDQIQAIRESLGADEPLVVQYLTSISSFLRGDFGYSVASGAAVSDLVAAALPATLVLAVLGLILAVFLGVTIAFTATYGAGGWLRRLFRGIPPFFVSLPVFWIGIILIQIFSFRLGLVPVIGADPVQALILPVITLAIPIAAPLAQVLTRSIDEVRDQPFVAVVRARGASTSWLLWRNVARNALLPTLTMAGLLFGELVGGAVVTETVFARAGLGQLTAQAVANRDTPVLLAVVVITTVAFVTINLIVDLLYPVLDARLRGPGRRARNAPSTRASELTATSEIDADLAPGADPELAAAVAASDGDPDDPHHRRAARPFDPPPRVVPPGGLILSLVVIGVALLWAFLPALFTDQSPTQTVGLSLQAPSAEHWFGTDATGRDLYARVVYGASQSIIGALVAVAVGLVVGTAAGVTAGAVGGAVDEVLMRVVDVLLAIPALLLSLSVVILLGFGTTSAAIAVGVTSIAVFARLARSRVVSIRVSDFVEAAYGSGGRFFGVLWRHVLPNSLTPVIALAALQLGSAILQISTLGFLGYGAPPPTPEWGLLIAEGRNYVATAWWLTVLPGIVVVLVVLATNRLSQALRGGDVS